VICDNFKVFVAWGLRSTIVDLIRWTFAYVIRRTKTKPWANQISVIIQCILIHQILFNLLPFSLVICQNNIQSESDNWTNPVIESSILPITGHAIAIQYPDQEIRPYRVAIYPDILIFGLLGSGYWTPTVLLKKILFKISMKKIAE
jgi:hypothetical protein